MMNNSTSRQMGFLSQLFNLIICGFQIFLPAFSIVMIALLNFLPLKSCSRRNLVRPLIFGLAFFLSILNAGKEHAGDLKNYFVVFDQMESLSFFSIITLAYGEEREPVFWFFLYLFRDLEFSTFLFFFSFVTYFSAFTAIYEVGKNNDADYRTISLVIFFTGLFYINFSLSVHLMRQFLATVFLVLAMAAFSKGRNFRASFLILTAIFTHNMMILVAPAFILASSPVSALRRHIFAVTLTALSFFIVLLSGVFDQIIDYILLRFNGANQDLNLIGFGYAVFAIGASALSLVYGRLGNKPFTKLFRFILLSLTAIVIMGTFLPVFNDLGARFFSVLLFIFPMLFFLLPKFWVKPIYPAVVPALFFSFIYNLLSGAWEYQSVLARAILGGLWGLL